MASRESSPLFSLERGPRIALRAMQEKKALNSRRRGCLRSFLELRRPWGFSDEARRGSQGDSRAAPGKSGLHALGEGERVLALESREGTRASRRIEEGLSMSFSGCGGKASFPSTSAGDLMELPRVPLRPPVSSLQTETRLDSLEATQWARRDPRRGSRGEQSPLLPLEARPDFPWKSAVQPRDSCLPLRGQLGSGHTPR